MDNFYKSPYLFFELKKRSTCAVGTPFESGKTKGAKCPDKGDKN